MVVRVFQVWMTLAFVASVWLLGSLGADEFKRLQTRRWPTAPAQITQSAFHCQESAKSKMCWPVMRYIYTVHDHRYEGTIVQIGTPGGFESEIKRLVDRYPNGSKTHVFYNSITPSDAILDPSIRSSNYYAELFLGLMLLIMAATIRFVFL